MRLLRTHELDGEKADALIQSFVREVARYADRLGPNKDLVLPRDAGGAATARAAS